MSAATEFAPAVVIPARARRAVGPSVGAHAYWDGDPAPGFGGDVEPGVLSLVGFEQGPPSRLAGVSTLHAPRTIDESAAPLRLTRRGVVVLGAAVAALAAALLWLAARSAPAGVSAPPATHVVTVQSGDTLWSIASRVAPQRDPRAEVDALQRANHLSAAALSPGQTLRVP